MLAKSTQPTDNILLDELTVMTGKLSNATRAEDIKAINRIVIQLLKEFIKNAKLR